MAEEHSDKKLKYDDKYKEKERKSLALMVKGRKALEACDFENAANSFRRAIKKRVALYGGPRLDIKDCCRVGYALLMDTLCDYDVISNNDEEDNVSEDEVSGDEEGSRDNQRDTKDINLAFQLINDANKIAEEKLNSCSLEKADLLNLLAQASIRRNDMERGLSLRLEALAILQCLVEPYSLLIVRQYMLLCYDFLTLDGMSNAKKGIEHVAMEGMSNAKKGVEHMEIALKLL